MWAHGRFSMIFKVLDLIRREDAPAAGASALFIRFKFGGIIGSVEVGIAELIIFFSRAALQYSSGNPWG